MMEIPMAKSTTPRKNTPKVTNVQKRMTKEQQQEWFTKNCSKLDAATQTAIKDKLAAPLTVRKAAMPKAYDKAWAASLTTIQLASVKTVVDAEFKSETRQSEKAKVAAEIRARMETDAAALQNVEG